jgi:hypothetical protein
MLHHSPSLLERHILMSTSDERGKAFSGIVEPDFIEQFMNPKKE